MARDAVKIKDGGLILNLKKITPEIEDVLLEETRRQSDLLTNFIIENHLTGGTGDTRLKVRTGEFRSLTLPIKPLTYTPTMKGGTQFGAKSAPVHVGERGKRTKIRPVTAKYLAIPIAHALAPSGAARFGSPRNVPGLSLIESKKGNLLLVRSVGGAIEPYFVLKKEVEIPARIHPSEILSKNIRRIARQYGNEIEKVLEKGL